MAAPKRKPKTPAKAPAKIGANEMLAYYREMLLIRRFEEKAGQMYGMGLLLNLAAPGEIVIFIEKPGVIR